MTNIFKGGKMKKLSVSVIASLIILGLTVSAKAGYVSRQNDQGQRYQIRQNTGTSDWTPKFGVGFNNQIYAIPNTPMQLSVPGGTTPLQATAPADISFRMYAGPIGGEFDLGVNQYASSSLGDINVFNVGMKAFYTIISKTYVKFNAGMALNYTDIDWHGKAGSTLGGVLIGTGVNFFAGPEFFIPQLPELGFNIELGLGYQSYSGSGDHFAGDNLGFNTADFLQAGIHYYFN